AELALDGMGAGQDIARRLLAQHHAAGAVRDEEGRVGLAAADPLDRHGGSAELRVEIGVEVLRRELGDTRLHGAAAQAASAATFQVQNAAPSASRLLLSTIWCTSSAPSTSRAWRA